MVTSGSQSLTHSKHTLPYLTAGQMPKAVFFNLFAAILISHGTHVFWGDWAKI